MKHFALKSKNVIIEDQIKPALIEVKGDFVHAIHAYNHSVDCQTKDFGDYVIMPGLVDSHVHINEPGRTEWEGFNTATQAAAAGGITALVDMPLWDSGGSHLILWLQALILFGLNAVYQTDTETYPYPRSLHQALWIGILVLPIYSLISFYGLGLRIDQYGWSIGRAWAVLIASILFLFSLGYLWQVVRLRNRWTSQLGWVNIRMGWVILMLMGLVNSPIMDFRKISAASQLALLHQGKITTEEFDIHYLSRHLANPGFLALQDLKQQYKDSQPELVMRINNLYAGNPNSSQLEISQVEFSNTIELIDTELPEPLAEHLYLQAQKNYRQNTNTLKRLLFAIDLNNDNSRDFVLVEKQVHGLTMSVYYLTDGKWQSSYISHRLWQPDEIEAFIDHIRASEFKTQAPKWQQLVIGKQTFKVNE